MKRLFLGAAAVLVVTTGQAAAEGVGSPPSHIKAPGVPTGPNWNGFYVGVGLGAGALSQDLSGDQQLTQVVREMGCWHQIQTHTETSQHSFSDSDTGDMGVFGTITVGYDRVLREGWVGGVFADYDFGSNVSVHASYPGSSGSVDHRTSWAVGARLGYLLTESTLLYGTAGYTQADFDVGSAGSQTFDGYFVGAGIETYLRGNWTLKLEYRYSDFGSETIVDGSSINAELEPSMHSARLVLTYKIGNRD